MDNERFEQTIFINNKEVLVKINKSINNTVSKKIIDDFCSHLRQMKLAVKKIENYRPSDFDYIVLMLVLKHCTDFLKDSTGDFVDITLKYSSLITKNIIQQIFKSVSHLPISKDIDKTIITCRVVVQNELSIKKLENMLPSILDSEQPKINIIKIKNNKINNEEFRKEIEKAMGIKKNKTTKKKESFNFDDLIDQYNDAKFLYEFFGDEEYEKKMRLIVSKMKRKWKKTYGDEKSPQ